MPSKSFRLAEIGITITVVETFTIDCKAQIISEKIAVLTAEIANLQQKIFHYRLPDVALINCK